MRNAFLSLFMGFLGLILGLGISILIFKKLGIILPFV